MKTLTLLTLGFLLSLPALASDLTTAQLEALLRSAHTIDWRAHARTPADRAELRQNLRRIVDSRRASGTPMSQVEYRALAELGRFAATEEGRLEGSMEGLYSTLLREAKNQPDDSSDRIYLVQSLLHAETPETTRMLMELVSESDPMTSYLALQAIEKIFDRDSRGTVPSEGLSDLVPEYRPRADHPFEEGPASKPWQLFGKEIASRLESLEGRFADPVAPALLNAIQVLKEYRALDREPSSVDSPQPAEATAGIQKVSATDESIYGETDDVSLRGHIVPPGAWWLIGLVLMGAFIAIFRVHRNS